MMPTRMARLTAYFFLMCAMSVPSAYATEFTFSSRHDRFKVSITDDGAHFEGQSVSLEPFAYIKPLFDAEFADACPEKIGKPDVTISRERDGKTEKRFVYVEKKTVSDGQNCGEVAGHGLYELPLHRNWFTGKNSVTIGLGSSFSIWKNDLLVVEFTKGEHGWRNKDKKFFTNWDFFEKFERAVKDFPIDFRVHPAAARAYTTFELRQGDRKFTFVKVREKTWAVQFPGTPWLAASGQFGVFEDMDPNIWISPHAKTLQIITDITAPVDNRIKAVRSLTDAWGPNTKYVLHDIVLTPSEHLDLKKDIISQMRMRPTDENFKVLVDSLRTTDDLEILNYTTKALRVRNPKGPIVELEEPKSEAEKKIGEWVKWRKTLK